MPNDKINPKPELIRATSAPESSIYGSFPAHNLIAAMPIRISRFGLPSDFEIQNSFRSIRFWKRKEDGRSRDHPPFSIFHPRRAQIGAGAGFPNPGNFGGTGFDGASGNGVPAGAPCGGSTFGGGVGGV